MLLSTYLGLPPTLPRPANEERAPPLRAARPAGGAVVPFPAARPPRIRRGAEEHRGEILLFLGVRYERRAS